MSMFGLKVNLAPERLIHLAILITGIITVTTCLKLYAEIDGWLSIVISTFIVMNLNRTYNDLMNSSKEREPNININSS